MSVTNLAQRKATAGKATRERVREVEHAMQLNGVYDAEVKFIEGQIDHLLARRRLLKARLERSRATARNIEEGSCAA